MRISPRKIIEENCVALIVIKFTLTAEYGDVGGNDICC
jgi:hypothetical protein